MDKFVSVIIPVLDNIAGLRQTLASLDNQTYPKQMYEVIVVDNGSKEDLAKAIAICDQAKLIKESQPGSYIARNRGIGMARGEILAFTDSDCIPEPNWLTNGVKALISNDNCGLVAGKINFYYQNPDRPTTVELYDSITFLDQERYVREHQYGATANMFTWKKVIDTVGNFNPSLKSGGDKEWGKRVALHGYTVVCSADVCIDHPARYYFSEIWQKIARTRTGGYTADRLSSDRNLSFYGRQLLTIIWRLKPPTKTAAQKFNNLSYPLNKMQKVELLLMIISIHYRGVGLDIINYAKTLKYIF